MLPRLHPELGFDRWELHFGWDLFQQALVFSEVSVQFLESLPESKRAVGRFCL